MALKVYQKRNRANKFSKEEVIRHRIMPVLSFETVAFNLKRNMPSLKPE